MSKLDSFIEESITNSCGSVSLRWWDTFKKESENRPALFKKVAEEIYKRNVNVETFFLAFIGTAQDNIGECFDYLDHLLKHHPEIFLMPKETQAQREERSNTLLLYYQKFRNKIS